MELTLGRAIRERRVELGLTQEELAERVAGLGDEAMRQSDISRIERGQVQLPRLPRLEMIAAALETNLGSLLIAAGWLSGEQTEPPAENGDEARPDTPNPGKPVEIREAHQQAISNAYLHLVNALGDSVQRHAEFARRRAEFERMVREFERVREEFRSAQEE